jgi:hypothetical protein
MRIYLVLLAAAVLIFGSATAVSGKPPATGAAPAGQENSAVGDFVMAKWKNDVPYGQIKKAGDESGPTTGGPPGWAAAVGAGQGVQQVQAGEAAGLDGRIPGGHHNSIVLESSQIAASGGAASGSLVQASSMTGQIDAGHHNTIIVEASQIGWTDGSATSDLVQLAEASGLILGGHHNTIIIGSLQAAGQS